MLRGKTKIFDRRGEKVEIFKKSKFKKQINKRKGLVLNTILACLTSHTAYALELDSGEWESSLNTSITIGTSVRAQDPDSKLYSRADGIRAGLGSGGLGATNTDSSNVNYLAIQKHQNISFSLVGKLL